MVKNEKNTKQNAKKKNGKSTLTKQWLEEQNELLARDRKIWIRSYLQASEERSRLRKQIEHARNLVKFWSAFGLVSMLVNIILVVRWLI